MALGHTILAALSVESLSGYDLAKKFADKNGCYWRATQQQIYRELGKLEEEGMVISETIPQAGRPDKKLYRITDSGRGNLRKWIAQPSEPTPIREDLLVKVLAGHLVSRPVILQELERRRQIHLEQLLIYKEWHQNYCQNVAELSPPEQCRCLTLRRGIRYESEWVAWCEEAMQLFSE